MTRVEVISGAGDLTNEENPHRDWSVRQLDNIATCFHCLASPPSTPHPAHSKARMRWRDGRPIQNRSSRPMRARAVRARAVP